MTEPTCPACARIGEHYEEDQWACNNPECRTVVYHNYGQTSLSNR